MPPSVFSEEESAASGIDERQSLLFSRKNSKSPNSSIHDASITASESSISSSSSVSSDSEQEEDHQQDNDHVQQASRLREILFPIYGPKEITKFTLLSFMNFCIIVVLTLTRDTKDTLVVTKCGAEAIAFLKIYGVLPAALAFTAFYGHMSSTLSKEMLFYVSAVPLFSFFVVYDLFLYPNAEWIEPSYDFLLLNSKIQNKLLLSIISNWTSAVYFIVAEIYSSVSVGILFWKFASEVVSSEEAKRFFSLFAYMSSLGPIVAGQYSVLYASEAHTFAESLRRLTVAITLCGALVCLLHYILTREEKNDHEPKCNSQVSDTKKKKKMKMSTMESLRFLGSSQYLQNLTVLVVGYGIMYNFIEISWKSLLRKQNPDPLNYQRFMGNFSSVVGAVTLVIILFGSNVISRLGWRIGALATPFVMTLLAIPFFLLLTIFDIENSPTALNTSVTVGTGLVLASRSFKYGMFDATTQMAYVPLDEESRAKGKAAIDVLGSRLGKSGASFIQQCLVLVFGDILSAAPAVAVVYYLMGFSWLSSAHKLGNLYNEKVRENEEKQKRGKMFKID